MDDPEGSDTQASTTNYDQLYANVIKWQEKGWIDYCIPQLYWQIGHPAVDFDLLAHWWSDHTYHRAMYIGQAVYKSDSASTVKEWTLPDELPKQIKLLRKIPGISGSSFYSSNHFNRYLMGFQDSLKFHLYKTVALVPPMPWLDSIPPEKVLNFKHHGKKIKWETTETDSEPDKPNRFIIYLNEKNTPFDAENPESIYHIQKEKKYKFPRLNEKKKKYEIRVSALDRLNNESELSKPVTLKL